MYVCMYKKEYKIGKGKMDGSRGISASIEVKLLDDLTRYDKRLTIGEVGKVIDIMPRRGDRFATVKFNNGACLDVLWKGLEIIDEKYLEEQKIREDEDWEALKGAKNVKVVRGPYGGFRHISYEYIKEGVQYSTSNYEKGRGEELIEYFKKNGVEIKEEKLEVQRKAKK